jgi:hypothetical protein
VAVGASSPAAFPAGFPPRRFCVRRRQNLILVLRHSCIAFHSSITPTSTYAHFQVSCVPYEYDSFPVTDKIDCNMSINSFRSLQSVILPPRSAKRTAGPVHSMHATAADIPMTDLTCPNQSWVSEVQISQTPYSYPLEPSRPKTTNANQLTASTM